MIEMQETKKAKVIMTLEFCDGVVTFFDNGHKVLEIDLKKESLEKAKEQVYVYLRRIINGLHKIYFVEGFRYD